MSHEVHDNHVSKFTVCFALKPLMEVIYQLYQVDHVMSPSLNEISPCNCLASLCLNRKLHMPGHISSKLKEFITELRF